MRSGVAGASVFNTCKSGANFRAAERAAEPTNGEAAFQPEGSSPAAEPTNREATFRPKRASGAAESTNREVLQPESTSRAAASDTARLSPAHIK